jgi:hypothetical protein
MNLSKAEGVWKISTCDRQDKNWGQDEQDAQVEWRSENTFAGIPGYAVCPGISI